MEKTDHISELETEKTNNIADPDATLSFFESDSYKERRAKRDEQEELYQKMLKHTNSYRAQSNIPPSPNFNNPYPSTLSQIMQQSIGGQKKQADINRKKTNHKKSLLSKKIKTRLIAVAAIISIGATATMGVVKVVEGIQHKIEMHQDINEAENHLKAYARMQLIEHNLAGFDTETGKFIVKNNSVNDYEQLGITDPNHDRSIHALMYIYKEILPYEEFNKLVQSIRHGKNLGSYYQGIYDVNNQNGYYDNYGAPSVEVFDNYMESYIYNHYDEIINTFNTTDGIYTFEDLNEFEQLKKGGR